MKKVVRIKESELVNLIDKIITETTRKQKISEGVRKLAGKQIIKEQIDNKKIEAKFWLVDWTEEPLPRVLRFTNLDDAKKAKTDIIEGGDNSYMHVPIFNSLKDLKYELDNMGLVQHDVEIYRYMK